MSVSSYLGRLAGETFANRPELRRMAAALFHKKGVVVIWPDEVRNEFDRQHLINIGEKLYGERERLSQ